MQRMDMGAASHCIANMCCDIVYKELHGNIKSRLLKLNELIQEAYESQEVPAECGSTIWKLACSETDKVSDPCGSCNLSCAAIYIYKIHARKRPRCELELTPDAPPPPGRNGGVRVPIAWVLFVLERVLEQERVPNPAHEEGAPNGFASDATIMVLGEHLEPENQELEELANPFSLKSNREAL